MECLGWEARYCDDEEDIDEPLKMMEETDDLNKEQMDDMR